MTVTPERRAQIGFSEPIALVREQLVCRLGEKKIRRSANLQGRKVALRKSSSFFQTVEDLRKDYPKIQEEIVPENVETEEILDGVGDGKYDVAVADSSLVEAVMTYRDDLKVAFDLTGDHPLAWGLRPDAAELKKALDRFLDEEQLARKEETAYQEDLPGIEKRKVLRVLTRNSAATYFLWKGEVLGFEYELAKAFANRHGLRL